MVAPAHLYCAKCGTDNPTQAAFCFACGHPLQAAAGGLAISSFTGLLAQHHESEPPEPAGDSRGHRGLQMRSAYASGSSTS